MQGYWNRRLGIILLLLLLTSGLVCIKNAWGVEHAVLMASSGAVQSPLSPPHDNLYQRPGGGPPGNSPVQQGGPPRNNIGGDGAGTGHDTQIAVYAAVFLVLFAAAYLTQKNKRIKIPPGSEKVLVIALLCAGLVFRMACSNLVTGHPFDIGIFRGWAAAAAENLFHFYSGPRLSDYPPLYIYILFLIGKMSGLSALSPYTTFLLKLPSMLADIAVTWIIYRLARKRLTMKMSLLLSVFYLFNPAVIINSTLWGQVDSFFTLIIAASVWALSEKKLGLSAVLFTASVLMKPQGIIFLPVLFFALVRERSPKAFLKVTAMGLGTAAIIILPFSWHQDALWIFRLFTRTVGEYPYAAVNAFNFFSLLGKNYARAADTFLVMSYQTWGLIFIVTVTALTWFIYLKGNRESFASAAALLLIAGVFTFSTSMHERYLFPAIALSIMAFIQLCDERMLYLSAGFTATTYVNTHVVLANTFNGINAAAYDPILITTSLLNVVLFIYLVKVLIDCAVLDRRRNFTGIAR